MELIVTERAQNVVRSFIEQTDGEHTALRIVARLEGSDGPKFDLTLVSEADKAEDDIQVDVPGFSVFVGKESAERLNGAAASLLPSVTANSVFFELNWKDMEQRKSATTFQQIVTFLLVMAPFLIIAALFGSHVAFQKRIVGVMQYSAAQDIGLLPRSAGPSPFGPRRVWIAKNAEGGFEFRSAWPLIGSVPFDFFGSGTTDVDLLSACDRLGDGVCRRI